MTGVQTCALPICPDCGEYLEHKESQEKKDITWIDKEARDKMFYVDFQNPAVLWTHNQWPDCETCPNKPDPNKPVFGDTPCTWCPKNRPYCTCTTGEFKVDGLNNDLKLTSTVSGEYSTAFSADSTETKDKK